MVYTSKKKQLQELEKQKQRQEQENIRNRIPQEFDFIPSFKKEIECWKSAIVNDINTGAKTYWPIDPVMAKRHKEYETFLSKIFNSEIGKFYPQIRDDKPRVLCDIHWMSQSS